MKNRPFLFILCAIVALPLTGASCGENTQTDPNTDTSTADVQTNSTTESLNTADEQKKSSNDEGANVVEGNTAAIVAVGEDATIGDVTYRVTGVELLPDEIPTAYHNYASALGEPKKADRARDWIRLEMTVKNNANEEISLFGSKFIVVGSDNKEIQSSHETTTYTPTDMNFVLESDIAAGASQQYVLYFDVAEQVSNFRFRAPDVDDALTHDVDYVTVDLSLNSTQAKKKSVQPAE